MTNDLRIDLSDHGRGTVSLDGVELHGVLDVEFSAAVGSLNRVAITLEADRAVICAPAEVVRRTVAAEAPTYFEYMARRRK